MADKYANLIKNISGQMAKMNKDMPEFISAFNGFAKATHFEGALDRKTKELLAVALAVAGHCPGCLAFHARSLVRHKATREELMETLAMAVYMGGGPSMMYAADALEAFEEFSAD